MPSFTIDEIKKSLGIDTTVVETSLPEKTQKGFKAMGQVTGRSIPETKELIKKGIEAAGRPLSFGEICAILERKKAPHIRKLLHEMGDSGELVETTEIAANRMLTWYWYSLP